MVASDNIADDIPVPVLSLHKDDMTIRWANLAAQEWLGMSLRSLRDRRLKDIFDSFQGIFDAIDRCAETLGPVSLHDYILKREAHPDQKCQITVFPSRISIGLMIQAYGKQPTQTRTGGQAVSAMGRMLAHEIKNPLAGIHGAAQLLRPDVVGEEGQALIDLIGSEISRIRRLTDRMETLGDHDPDTLAPVNIHQILRKARTVVASASDNKLVFTEQYDPSLPDVYGDADTLMQAILNLIKNAAESIERSSQPGEVQLRTAFRSGVRRQVNGEADKALPVEIIIQDSGPGISENVRNRLFEPFVTDKPTGQGLGLALVSKIATAHGGLVEVQSRPGKTTFSLLLPTSGKDTPA